MSLPGTEGDEEDVTEFVTGGLKIRVTLKTLAFRVPGSLGAKGIVTCS